MEREELNNSTVIKNISTDQSEILKWIMDMHNNGEPFECDMTASKLSFYKTSRKQKCEIPIPGILFDVYPTGDHFLGGFDTVDGYVGDVDSDGTYCIPPYSGIQRIVPFRKLPLNSLSISSLVCDLPFVCSPHTCKSVVDKKEGSNLISNRFSSWYPMQEGYENIYWWVNECNRVLKPGGILVWKMQSSVSGGLQHLLSEFSALCAADCGLYIQDQFFLEAKARLISASKIKKQGHARKYTSAFWVFRKDDKKGAKTNILKKLQECKESVYEGKVWPVK
jgi:hypothetical protein